MSKCTWKAVVRRSYWGLVLMAPDNFAWKGSGRPLSVLNVTVKRLSCCRYVVPWNDDDAGQSLRGQNGDVYQSSKGRSWGWEDAEQSTRPWSRRQFGPRLDSFKITLQLSWAYRRIEKEWQGRAIKWWITTEELLYWTLPLLAKHTMIQWSWP